MDPEGAKPHIMARIAKLSGEYRLAVDEGRWVDAALLEVRIDELELTLASLN